MIPEHASRFRRIGARLRIGAIRGGTSVTIVVGALSLLGFLAAWAWPLELLCHFRVQYSVLFPGILDTTFVSRVVCVRAAATALDREAPGVHR